MPPVNGEVRLIREEAQRHHVERGASIGAGA